MDTYSSQNPEPRYRGFHIRLRLTTLGCRYRADYAIENGQWRDAPPGDSRDWALGIAEYEARREIDRLRLTMAS